MKPALVSEEKQESPILIVDKIGVIGEELAKNLEKEALVVLVTRKENSVLTNTVYIPFKEKFPKIPDNTYSHIIVIDDNDSATREALPSFIKKADNDKSHFLLVVELSEEKEKSANYVIENYSKSKVVVYGTIFSKAPLFNTILNKLIYQAEHTGRLEVPGDGMKNIYPVLFEDLISGILEALFGTDRESKIYYLLPKKPYTLLTFAHMIQKIIPGVGIDFVKKEDNEKELKPKEGKYIFGENYDIEQRIRNLNLEERSEKDIKTVEYKPNIFKEKREKSKIAFYFLSFLFFLILLPLLSTAVFSFFGAQALNIAKKNLEKGDSKNAVIAAESASIFFKYATKTGASLVKEAEMIGQKKVADNFLLQIKRGEGVSKTALSLSSAASSFKDVYYGSSKDKKKDINDAINSLRQSIIFVQKEKTQGDDFLGVLKNGDPIISFASATLDIWPEIMGLDKKKTYLVLFQNSMELRPGGGFIGSYGILTIDKGKILDFSIHDVYDADGQLKTKIEPPLVVRRYMKNKNLFLRDSNYSPDFPEDAAKAAFLLNIETSQKVNGVIGVDLYFIKSLLSGIGPIKVSDYNETVDENNFFTITESHVEKDFFPGSTQKKDFLRALFNSIQNQINNNKEISYLLLTKSIFESLEKKHLLLVFDKPSVQNIFSVNNWSSSLWDGREDSSSVINDFLGVSEANVGGNKANYFINKSTSYDVKVHDNGKITSKLKITYKNSSDGSWPGGDYKNYLTLIFPLGSKIDSIKIDSKDQTVTNAVIEPLIYESSHFLPPEGIEVEKKDDYKKTMYSFFVNIPKEKTKTIEVGYTNPKTISFVWPDFTYNLRLYKQPGVDDYNYSFSLKYPDKFEVVDQSNNFLKGNSGLSSSFKLEKDLNYFVKLGKK
jgi:hypothetical protein